MTHIAASKVLQGRKSDKREALTSKQILNQRGRVTILVDSSSLFYAALQMCVEVDYSKLLPCLVGDGRLIHAFFYTGVDPNNAKQKGFLTWMKHNGYRVVEKELQQTNDGYRKASLEVEITVDMLKATTFCDTLVLLSGNGNLAYAVDTVSYQGIRTEVIGLRSMTSDALINVADTYIDLDTLKHQIASNLEI